MAAQSNRSSTIEQSSFELRNRQAGTQYVHQESSDQSGADAACPL